jgi:ABC-type xylose transport system permease subunit
MKTRHKIIFIVAGILVIAVISLFLAFYFTRGINIQQEHLENVIKQNSSIVFL